MSDETCSFPRAPALWPHCVWIQSCRLRQLACSDETILVVQDGRETAMHIVNVQNLHFPGCALTPDRDVESVFTMNQSRNETVPEERR